MKIKKRVISDLTLCYCICPLKFKGQNHFIVASEKEFPCLLFDEDGNEISKIWDAPGGTMSAVQLPDSDGIFLATHRSYSPNNAKEASIVMAKYTDNGWSVQTLLELPFVHRFDILERDDRKYLIACTMKSDMEYKDDWRFPGAVYGCELPDNISEWNDNQRLEVQVIKDNMLKNHGYSRHMHNGLMTGIVTADNGIFRFTPPETKNGNWGIDIISQDPASDALFVDLDEDGKEELLTISPFHGDTISIYKESDSKFEKIWEHDKKLTFAHAICKANVNGKNYAIIGYRREDRDLLAFSFDGKYKAEIIDYNTGAANVSFFEKNGEKILIAANREINEVAYYTIIEE